MLHPGLWKVLLAGEGANHLHSTAEVPSSKASNPQWPGDSPGDVPCLRTYAAGIGSSTLPVTPEGGGGGPVKFTKWLFILLISEGGEEEGGYWLNM